MDALTVKFFSAFFCFVPWIPGLWLRLWTSSVFHAWTTPRTEAPKLDGADLTPPGETAGVHLRPVSGVRTQDSTIRRRRIGRSSQDPEGLRQV